MNELRMRALNHPRVRALLNADGAGDTQGESPERWQGAQVWVLASFSMPKTSLRQLMQQSQKYGVPVVFRGFVNNSVYDTRDALLQLFDSDADFAGFGIDPTMFTRFDVSAVPTFIAVPTPFDICETQGCENDAAPEHDRVAGNIPIDVALRTIAKGGGPASKIAALVLERSGP